MVEFTPSNVLRIETHNYPGIFPFKMQVEAEFGKIMV
jgi:hypothetical protein